MRVPIFLSAKKIDVDLGAWRVDALRIPGAKLSAVMAGGRKCDLALFPVEAPDIIRRLDKENPEEDVVAIIELEDRLTRRSSTVLAVVLGFIGTIGAALIGIIPSLLDRDPTDAAPSMKALQSCNERIRDNKMYLATDKYKDMDAMRKELDALVSQCDLAVNAVLSKEAGSE